MSSCLLLFKTRQCFSPPAAKKGWVPTHGPGYSALCSTAASISAPAPQQGQCLILLPAPYVLSLPVVSKI